MLKNVRARIKVTEKPYASVGNVVELWTKVFWYGLKEIEMYLREEIWDSRGLLFLKPLKKKWLVNHWPG